MPWVSYHKLTAFLASLLALIARRPTLIPLSSAGSTVTAGTVAYLLQGALNTTESNGQFCLPFNGYITALETWSMGAPGADQTFTYTVRINSVDTSIQNIHGAADSTKSGSGLVSVSKGDRISVKVEASGGAAAVRHRASVLVCEANAQLAAYASNLRP